MKPIHLIFTQMNLANLMMFLGKGPDILINMGLENIMNVNECKVLNYLYRPALALSICFTCYLSTFQAIIISSSVSRLGKFKPWVLDHIIHACLFLWIFNLLLEIPVIFSMTGPRQLNNITSELNFGYCSLERDINHIYWMMTLRNIFVIVLIIWFCCYLVYMLYRHYQKVNIICSSSISIRTFPEVIATQTTLLLVSLFVFFYSLISLCSISLTFLYQQRFCLLPICTILSLCFPTLSPFVLSPQGSWISLSFWAGKNILPI
ncbi:vomeronasal type-1 receptor 4-like [Macrotis lagotis]|uniref:vomeronasal type-1 receptor 4-like n=1 Tax=Macrotis lagotis TaxID=92651 RepID=UPI003D69DBDF